MSTSEATFRQAKHTLEIVAQHDLSIEEMRTLHDGLLSDFLEGIHISHGTCFPSRDELRVFLGLLPKDPTLEVDYDLHVNTMIFDGHYDIVRHPDNPEIFTSSGQINRKVIRKTGSGKKQLKIRLVEISDGGYSLADNEAEGCAGSIYRLARFEELLAFGAKFPKVQLRCKNGIYGRAYDVLRFHPHLWGANGARGLTLEAGGLYTNPGTHFLFVER